MLIELINQLIDHNLCIIKEESLHTVPELYNKCAPNYVVSQIVSSWYYYVHREDEVTRKWAAITQVQFC